MGLLNARHVTPVLPSIASRTGHHVTGLHTLSTAVHRSRGLRDHVLRGLVHCQAMKPEWVRRVHEALKKPAQAPKAAQNASFSLHQQLLLARCVSDDTSVHAAQVQSPLSAWLCAMRHALQYRLCEALMASGLRCDPVSMAFQQHLLTSGCYLQSQLITAFQDRDHQRKAGCASCHPALGHGL